MMCLCGSMMKVYKHERNGHIINYLWVCSKCGRTKTTKREVVHTYEN
jgi:DNA-directed RNA polymerase subunit M/transcription elongation factor TFIIS